MREVMLVSLILCCVCPRVAHAQDSKEPIGRPDAVVLGAGHVNYWGVTKRPQKAQDSRRVAESIWLEPIATPDGRYAPYAPPPHVIQFLDDPTPETARSYLRWQSERIAKLRRAMELLEGIGRSEQVQAAPREVGAQRPAAVPGPDMRGSDVQLLYFKQPECRYCALQDEILAQLRTRQSGIKVREVAKGTSAELWRQYGVTVTPTIVLLQGDKARQTFSGLAQIEQIAAAIHRDAPNEK